MKSRTRAEPKVGRKEGVQSVGSVGGDEDGGS